MWVSKDKEMVAGRPTLVRLLFQFKSVMFFYLIKDKEMVAGRPNLVRLLFQFNIMFLEIYFLKNYFLNFSIFVCY